MVKEIEHLETIEMLYGKVPQHLYSFRKCTGCTSNKVDFKVQISIQQGMECSASLTKYLN